ncbi:MAG: cytochrome c3 family protein [Chloroflexota bacterium]
MQHKKLFIPTITIGVLLMAITGLWLVTASPASAQCGSQASSCKNCHEVQGEMPVNSDGTAWHSSHAFGDFCYICHAGNNQAMDKEGAHAGMVPPLSDIKASCQQCHPADLQERAQVYASALGVEIGEGFTPTGGTLAVEGETASLQTSLSAPVATELDVDDPNLVDYVQRYNEIVLGRRPVNVGNAILVVLIGLVAIGGSGYVFYNEVLSKLSLGNTKKVDGEYPDDVVDMLPAIANLKVQSRKTLRSILDNPQKLELVLRLIGLLALDEKNGEQVQ